MKRDERKEILQAFAQLTEAAEQLVNHTPRLKRTESDRQALLNAITHAQLVLSIHWPPTEPLTSKKTRRPSTLPIALLALLAFAGPAYADFSGGRVVSVLDGDTVEVLYKKKTERVRLFGIDCPEKGQAYGARAKQATSALLFGKDVTIETHGRDRQRRTLGTVFRDGINLNHLLVKEGWCWWDQTDAPKDTVLKQFEQEAKEEKKGLWADPKPVPPWLYRRLASGVYP